MDKIAPFSLGGHNPRQGASTLADRLRQHGARIAPLDARTTRSTLRLPTPTPLHRAVAAQRQQVRAAPSTQDTKGEAGDSAVHRSPNGASASPAVQSGKVSGESVIKSHPHPPSALTNASGVAQLPPSENLSAQKSGTQEPEAS